MGINSYFDNKTMKVVPEQYIPTTVPSTLSSLARQRIMSWDYVILKFIWQHVRIICKFERKNYLTKIIAFLNIWTICQDFLRIINIIIIVLYTTQYLWIILYIALVVFVKSFCILLILYTRKTFNGTIIPVKYGLFMIIGYPIYTVLMTFFRMIAEIRYLVWYSQDISDNILFKDRPLLPFIYNYCDSYFDKSSNIINWFNIFQTNCNFLDRFNNKPDNQNNKCRQNSACMINLGSMSTEI